MRYFALFIPVGDDGSHFGYVLDYYPDEKEDFLKENPEIIGDFATYDEAMDAVLRKIEERSNNVIRLDSLPRRQPD
jgi:hypothetical protein